MSCITGGITWDIRNCHKSLFSFSLSFGFNRGDFCWACLMIKLTHCWCCCFEIKKKWRFGRKRFIDWFGQRKVLMGNLTRLQLKCTSPKAMTALGCDADGGGPPGPSGGGLSEWDRHAGGAGPCAGQYRCVDEAVVCSDIYFVCFCIPMEALS